MKIDNFYFVVEDIEKSIRFYSELLEKKPTNIIENRWADWENENNPHANNSLIYRLSPPIGANYSSREKLSMIYDLSAIVLK